MADATPSRVLARCPLCGYCLWSDGRRAYCPRMIPGERRRCGYELRGGLDHEVPTFPMLTVPQRIARLKGGAPR